MDQEKETLINNLKFMAKMNKDKAGFISIRTDLPDKVILNCGEFIDQDEMNNLLEVFGNHAGLSYQLKLLDIHSISIEIFIKK